MLRFVPALKTAGHRKVLLKAARHLSNDTVNAVGNRRIYDGADPDIVVSVVINVIASRSSYFV